MLTIGLRNASEEAWKRRMVVSIDRGEIGAAIKRLPLWREKYGHGPTAASGEHLHGLHINFVNVRTFFAIDLDIDKKIIHQPGDLFIFEGLVLHHMAPMARR